MTDELAYNSFFGSDIDGDGDGEVGKGHPELKSAAGGTDSARKHAGAPRTRQASTRGQMDV